MTLLLQPQQGVHDVCHCSDIVWRMFSRVSVSLCVVVLLLKGPHRIDSTSGARILLDLDLGLLVTLLVSLFQLLQLGLCGL